MVNLNMGDIFYINKDGDIINVSDIASICCNNAGKTSYSISFKGSKHSLYCNASDYEAIKALIPKVGKLYDDKAIKMSKQAKDILDNMDISNIDAGISY
jgi:hypothetical protein